MLDELLQFCEKNDEDNEACEAFLEYLNTIKNEVCDGISTGVDSGQVVWVAGRVSENPFFVCSNLKMQIV